MNPNQPATPGQKSPTDDNLPPRARIMAAARELFYRQGIKSVGVDATPFRTEHLPGNPAADDKGDVKLPNVDLLFEMADMREANRSYEANLQVVKQSREMLTQTIDLMRT